ncbi:hypothetical protein BJY00DRAFT_313203 [Aspergillus carlsbadensis]|nr:hypothetical protein BJY00DRAFT_313203 [Aspergillus carlsbadensis]
MSSQPQPPKTAFISGPTDTGPNATFFEKHYIPSLHTAIAAGHDFIIGPILSGVDSDALDYLLSFPIAPSRITIYMTYSENKAWGQLFRDRGVRVLVLEDVSATTAMRDARMTADSDYDILRWRTEEEARAFYGEVMYRGGYVTNTERNWRRRRGLAENGELGRGAITVKEMVARE